MSNMQLCYTNSRQQLNWNACSRCATQLEHVLQQVSYEHFRWSGIIVVFQDGHSLQ